MFGHLGLILVPPGANLGPIWALLGPSWTPSRRVFRRFPGAVPPQSGEKAKDILQKSLPGGLESHLEGHLSHLRPLALHLYPILGRLGLLGTILQGRWVILGNPGASCFVFVTFL